MSWCRYESDVTHHPKTWTLRRLLDEPLADAYLGRIWGWAAACCPTGTLPADQARPAIESAAMWGGKPGRLFDALVEAGFVDVVQGIAQLHNWTMLNGYQIREAKRLRERKYLDSDTARVQMHAARTDGRTYKKKALPRTRSVETSSAQPQSPLAAAPLQRPELVVVPEGQADGKNGKGSPQALLVEAWSAVYLAKTGKPYRYSQADFIQGAALVKQGVTPEELTQTATKAFRPGISPYLQVRSFKQLVAKYPEVATARVLDSLHNIGTDEEFQEQAKREQQEALPSWILKPSTS